MFLSNHTLGQAENAYQSLCRTRRVSDRFKQTERTFQVTFPGVLLFYFCRDYRPILFSSIRIHALCRRERIIRDLHVDRERVWAGRWTRALLENFISALSAGTRRGRANPRARESLYRDFQCGRAS